MNFIRILVSPQTIFFSIDQKKIWVDIPFKTPKWSFGMQNCPKTMETTQKFPLRRLTLNRSIHFLILVTAFIQNAAKRRKFSRQKYWFFVWWISLEFIWKNLMKFIRINSNFSKKKDGGGECFQTTVKIRFELHNVSEIPQRKYCNLFPISVLTQWSARCSVWSITNARMHGRTQERTQFFSLST